MTLVQKHHEHMQGAKLPFRCLDFVAMNIAINLLIDAWTLSYARKHIPTLLHILHSRQKAPRSYFYFIENTHSLLWFQYCLKAFDRKINSRDLTK